MHESSAKMYSFALPITSILSMLHCINTILRAVQGLHSASIPGILSLDISSSDSSKILTGGNDRNATVFNKDTEQVVAILKGHTKKVCRPNFVVPLGNS